MRRPSNIFARSFACVVAVLLSLPVVAAFYALRLVPEKVALRFSGVIGRLIRAGMKTRILERVGWVLGPAMHEERSGAFWREHVRHLGGCVLEPIYFFWMPDAELRQRVSVEGEEHLRAALAAGRGAVLFLNHLGNPGAIVAGLGLRGHDLTIAGNRIVATIAGEEVALDSVEEIVQRMFRRGGVQRALLGERLPQRMAATLGRNGLFAMFVDFPVVQKHNHSVAFGNASMKLNLGPAILALRHRTPVLCVTCRRVGMNQHHLRIHPPLEAPAVDGVGRAAASLLQQATDLLSESVRECPEQWWPWDWAQISPGRPGP